MVIDVGVAAYNSSMQADALRAGTTLAGRVELGVDPFDYFEQLGRDERMPPLMYLWRVERIRIDTEPIPDDVRIDDRSAWLDVSETGHGGSSYLLDVSRLPEPPYRKPGRSLSRDDRR